MNTVILYIKLTLDPHILPRRKKKLIIKDTYICVQAESVCMHLHNIQVLLE